MNATLENVCRTAVKEKLALCTKAHQLFFNRMYAHKNLDQAFEITVDKMPAEKLSRALDQIEATLKKKVKA